MANNRMSNFELLRVVAMFIILLGHMVGHGVGHVLTEEPYRLMLGQGNNVNRAFFDVVCANGVIGYSIFFLISGYFASEKKRYKSALSMINEVFFYSALTIIVAIVAKFGLDAQINLGGCLSFLFPISSGIWWFVTVYLIITVFMNDVLLKMMARLSKRGTVMILVVFLFIYIVSSGLQMQYYLLESGILLYLIGIYIRKYCIEEKSTLIYVLTAITFWGVYGFLMQINASMTVDGIVNTKEKIIHLFIQQAYGICTLICAVSIFLIFKQLKIGESKKINFVASLTFGIYLMHDSSFGRIIYWDYIFKVDQLYNSRLFPIIAILLAMVCFIIFGGIEWIRQRFISNKMDKLSMEVISYLCKEKCE